MRSEADLLTAAVAGDQDALAALLEWYAPRVRRSLAGKIDKRWRSLLSEDDVMQETYADAFLSIRTFVPRNTGAFLRWLMTLARNNLLDAVRGLQTEKKGGDRVRLDHVTATGCDIVSVESGTSTHGGQHWESVPTRRVGSWCSPCSCVS